MFQKFFKYFNLSRTEQNGFFVLCTLILLLFSYPYIFDFFNKNDFDKYNIEAFTQLEKAAMANPNYRKRAEFSKTNNLSTKGEHIEKTLFPFDPNTLDEKGWIKLGFTEKQVNVILNYRDKGGKFYKKEDLAKIYSISPAEFKRVENFIAISPTDIQKQNHVQVKQYAESIKNDSRNKYVPTVIDINSGDTAALITLKGIGPTFAKRIIRYRESLGGFISTQQIKEVYGLSPETFEEILPYLTISPVHTVSKIYINDLDANTLSKHPYVSFKQGTAIVNYRNQHGRFQNLEDLKKVILLDDDFLRKLAPYLRF